jgi:NADPH:quinone reductase-like Zn-dependent oxidoreductase
MRSLSIFGRNGAPAATSPLVIDGAGVDPRIVPGNTAPTFDAEHPAQRDSVLLRVRAFSCNYRDKAFIVATNAAPSNRRFTIGSEFVAEVLEVGAGVASVSRGDRVVGQNHYALTAPGGPVPGMPTNNASRELQILPAAKVVKVPDALGDPAAAGFSLGAQTSYSMIRRAAVTSGSTVLVTAALSSTSLFLIAALKPLGARVFATTRSHEHDERLTVLGVEQVIHPVGDRRDFAGDPQLMRVAKSVGGFDVVFDPFFDVHLDHVVQCMGMGGRYFTCGLSGQTPVSAEALGRRAVDMRSVMVTAIMRNLTIGGNCLGVTSDLDAALRDAADGTFTPIVDSVFTGTDAVPFLHRTYCDRARFGRAIFSYDAC